MYIIFTANYFFVKDDILINNDALLLIDFMNLKTKPTQYFECTHRNIICTMFLETNLLQYHWPTTNLQRITT
jgi:hypothetical protein